MSLISDLMNKVLARVSAGKDALLQKLLREVLAKITLGALVEKFKAAGLEKVIASWISQGENQPITADQVSKLLGKDEINALASQHNVTPAEIEKLLAQHLPDLVDQLTPDGNLPAEK